VLYLTIQENEDVTQIVEILPSVTDKWTWLTRHLVSFTSGMIKKVPIRQRRKTLTVSTVSVVFSTLG